jgi:formylglycine-generating enzyme required for sulfatase activity
MDEHQVTMRVFILLLAPVLCLAQTCNTAPEHKRYAFILDDGKYAKLPPSSTAEADAQAMQRALTDAGFMVMRATNAPMHELFFNNRADFIEKVQPGDVVFFYYAGHIVQSPAEDDDYILPFDFDPAKAVNSTLAFSLSRFLDDLGQRKPSLTVVMIEGPHPVGVTILGNRAGLAVPDLSSGNILFATAAELATSEALAVTSLFTRTVAELLGKQGLRLPELFDDAKQHVIDQSGRSQVPRIESNLSGASASFCFREAVLPPPPPLKTEIKEIIKKEVETIAIPTNKTDHEEYVLIHKGTFKMGCVPSDTKCKPEEKPQHEVTLSKDFWMGRNEVQVSSFKHFLDMTKKKMPFSAPLQDFDHWKVGSLPMVRVTWQWSSDYCKWAGGRLPTEAEWEYAARAGGVNEIYPLNNENSRDKANFSGTQGNDTYPGVAPVRQFEPNNFKLFDMAGNVWEWVADWYGPYADAPAEDPKGPPTGKERIFRGGSYESPWQENLRLSLRLHQGKDYEDWRTGFRCVLDDTDETHKSLNIP